MSNLECARTIFQASLLFIVGVGVGYAFGYSRATNRACRIFEKLPFKLRELRKLERETIAAIKKEKE